MKTQIPIFCAGNPEISVRNARSHAMFLMSALDVQTLMDKIMECDGHPISDEDLKIPIPLPKPVAEVILRYLTLVTTEIGQCYEIIRKNIRDNGMLYADGLPQALQNAENDPNEQVNVLVDYILNMFALSVMFIKEHRESIAIQAAKKFLYNVTVLHGLENQQAATKPTKTRKPRKTAKTERRV